MSKDILIERGDTCVWIEMKDGDLRISGQTLRGSSEYEYFITVEPQHFGAIRQDLSGGADDDVIGLIKAHRERIFAQGETTWLKSLGIEHGFSNYFDADFL